MVSYAAALYMMAMLQLAQSQSLSPFLLDLPVARLPPTEWET
jgi:hypothetical protein